MSSRRGDPGAPRLGHRWWRDAVGIDSRSLGLFRIGIAAVLLCDLGSRAADLRAHYSDWGVMPRWAVATWIGRGAWLSPWMWRGEAWWAALWVLVTAAAAVALLVGWRSRAMAAICFVLAAGLHARNPAVVHSGDNLLRVLLFWMPWLPLPGAWTVGRERARSGEVLASPGVLAIRLQLCLVYWVSALLKLNAAWLVDRDAVLTALWYDQFVTSWGKVLRRFPAAMRAMAPATVGLELLGPLLVWTPRASGPIRTLVVFAFVGFHLMGLGPSLALGTFPWVCAAAWMLFLPSWFWQRVRPPANAPAGGEGAVEIAGEASAAPAWSGRRRAAAAVAALLVVYSAVLAAAEVWPHRVRLPAGVALPADVLGIRQRWNMFVVPPRDDGWLVVVGRLADGTARDVWRDAPLEARKPDSVAESFGNSRWIKYLSQLDDPSFVHHRRLFGDYLCRRWNESHTGPARLAGLQIFFVLEPTLPDGGGDGDPSPLLIWQQRCQ